MAMVPVSMQVVIYPRNKTVAPYPATIVGYAWLTGLSVGGGPVEPPEQLPPIDPGPPVDNNLNIAVIVKEAPKSGGWGFAADEGWFYAPGPTQPGPKR